MMNVGNPQDAFSLAEIPNDGVGLARLEFIIANHIQAHPLALIHFDEIADPATKKKLADMTFLYDDKTTILCGSAGGRRRNHRGGILSEAGNCAPVGF